MSTYLYIYDNQAQKRIYIGIGDSMERVWQPHNPEAEALRGATGTRILQTVTPFSTRDDALNAEAIAIYLAALMGKTVIASPEMADADVDLNSGQVTLTNIAGTESTKKLAPAVYVHQGPDDTVEFDDLTQTAVVVIRSDAIDDRPVPSGIIDAATFSGRARQWWDVAEDKRPHIRHLVAKLKSSNIILGSWEVDPDGSWEGRQFPLVDPSSDNDRGLKGKKLVGFRGNLGQVYTKDIPR